MIADLDKLGQWIEGARNSVKPASIRSGSTFDLYEFNVRNQIIVWGYRQNIEHYAIKQWAGL